MNKLPEPPGKASTNPVASDLTHHVIPPPMTAYSRTVATKARSFREPEPWLVEVTWRIAAIWSSADTRKLNSIGLCGMSSNRF
ncbi:hypothetical protein [Nitrogeniibacter aestuarii]|uniref:hypothetical protein n=1 Tax=Nitrogeniibacter aestuarii TaxID=2815343 RepID=UPI001E439482|nr:hypothetical protein [Nitrogeniibacter aestuarii]